MQIGRVVEADRIVTDSAGLRSIVEYQDGMNETLSSSL